MHFSPFLRKSKAAKTRPTSPIPGPSARFLTSSFFTALGLLSATSAQAQVQALQHESIDIYPASQVAKAAPLAVDGDLSDWKEGAFVQMAADLALMEQFSLRLALAYDEQGLYVAGRFNDLNPLVNHYDPRLDPFKAWNGDAMQLRFVTDGTLTHPLPNSVNNTDKVVHLTSWYFTDDQLPALDVRYGMDFHGAQTYHGPDAGFHYKKVEGGYVVEGRIPWSRMKAQAPQPGQSWLMTMQPLFSSAEGKVQHYFFDIIRQVGFQFQGTGGWGRAYFVKPDEVPTRLAALVQDNQRRFPTAVAQAPKSGFPVPYTNPAKGFVSLAICNERGQIVRTLLTKAAREAGAQTELWDGKDDEGKPVPAGSYKVKALTHPGITPRYVTSVMQSGNPPWGNSGKFGWGADHGVPVGATSDAKGNTYLVWTFNEGGDYLIQVDPTGRKNWGARISWGDFNGGAQDVVYDNGLIYTAKDGLNHGDIRNGKVEGGLFVYDAATGRARPFPNGQGKLLVTNWDRKLADGARRGWHRANLVAIATSPTRLFAALNFENKIVAYDKNTFQVAETYTVNKPRGMVFNARTNQLLAISGDQVVALDLAAQGAAHPLIASGLDHPQKLAFDPQGNLFISSHGKQMQVLVYNPQGKLLRRVGKTGGRPAVGKFDPNGMYEPTGVTVDSTGQLWVTEADETPKRISLWNATSGQLKKDFYGATAYAPMMAPDLDKPEEVYLHNTRFIVDYETGKWRPDATVYRQGYLGGEGTQPEGAEAVFGFMGATFQVATIAGQKYAYNGNGVIYKVEGDKFKPVAQYGLQKWESPALPDNDNATRIWLDENGDGIKQAAEVRRLPATSMRNNIHQFGGTFFPNGSFIKGKRIYQPSGLDEHGVPIYPLPSQAPSILKTEGEMGRYGNWLDVWPSMSSNWTDFYAIASRPAPNGSNDGSGGDSIVRFNRNGSIAWRYPRVAVNFGLKAPLAKTGDLFGALRIAGQVPMPKANGGEILGIGCYRGYFGFLSEEGLFIDQVGYDNGRGPSPAFDTFFIENFSGYFFKHPRTGKVYLFAGDVDARILELQGFDKIQRFEPNSFTLTSAQAQQLAAGNAVTTGQQATAPLRVVAATPGLQGDAGWTSAPAASIALDEEKSAQVKLAYDQNNLYARFTVPDASPWQNGEGDWRFAFKGGDAVDIQLGDAVTTDKQAHRPGDVRVLLAPNPDAPNEQGVRAIAMWPVAPAGMTIETQVYKSPVAQESFERVALLQGVQSRVEKSATGYTITASIPWSTLGRPAPTPNAPLQGDVGVLLSDGGGTRTTLRRYLFNQDTNIVLDIPSEVRVVPANWGSLQIGG